MYRTADRKLRALEVARDRLAEKIKAELEAAAFGGRPVPRAAAQTAACEAIIARAEAMVGLS